MQFLFIHPCPFNSYSFYTITNIYKVVQGKFLMSGNYTSELTSLCQACFNE